MNLSYPLILREYETFRIGPRWDPVKKIVPPQFVAAIQEHQRIIGKELIQLRYRNGQATNWVGTLAVGNKCIEVIPKIDSSDGSLGTAQTRENLIHMVVKAGIVSTTDAGLAFLSRSEKPLLAALMALYIDGLKREWRRGRIRRYVTEEENRHFLRGKLVFGRHLIKNLVQKQFFFTAADEFVEDNNISQLLKAALRVGASQQFSNDVTSQARTLIPEFIDVSENLPTFDEMERIQVDRTLARFAPLISTAKHILRMNSPDSGRTGERVFSLMFDMNKVFERYIANEFKHACRGTNLRVKAQVGGKHLLKREGRGRFQLHPDLGLYLGNRLISLVDTKWKKLDISKTHDNISQSDMYQMYAYGKQYDVPTTVLIYPRFDDLPEVVGQYNHYPSTEEGSKTILVGTVDITKSMGQRINRRELRNCLIRLVETGDTKSPKRSNAI